MDDEVDLEVSLAEMRAGILLPIGRRIALRIDGLQQPNFRVHIELPDGSDLARNKRCVLQIPGEPEIHAVTDATGKLLLSLPNRVIEAATLRLFEGQREIARWTFPIRPEGA